MSKNPGQGQLTRRLVDTTTVSTPAGSYRLAWLVALIDQDRTARRQIRQLERDLDGLLDEHGTTLREEPRFGPIAAATLVAEVGDPFPFARGLKLLVRLQSRRALLW